MLSVFLYALNAVLPILLLIALGYFLRRIRFYDEKVVKGANKLVFRVFLPSLLFCNIYDVESFAAFDWATVLYCVVGVLVLCGLGVVVALLWIPDKKQRGVVVQCVYRSNFAVIGVPLGAALGGAEGSAMVALVSAITIPIFNILAVIVLTVFVGEEKSESRGGALRGIVKRIVTNPLIIGVALGLMALGIRALIPTGADSQKLFSLSRDVPMIWQVIRWLANAATPLALIALGGQFNFSATGRLIKPILIGTLGRIVVAPLLGIGVAYCLSAAGMMTAGSAQYATYIALFGSPVAVSSAIMAAEMHNDEQLAGQYVVWTSAGSAVTIFLITAVCRYAGLL